jgi:hypothetical protein
MEKLARPLSRYDTTINGAGPPVTRPRRASAQWTTTTQKSILRRQVAERLLHVLVQMDGAVDHDQPDQRDRNKPYDQRHHRDFRAVNPAPKGWGEPDLLILVPVGTVEDCATTPVDVCTLKNPLAQRACYCVAFQSARVEEALRGLNLSARSPRVRGVF